MWDTNWTNRRWDSRLSRRDPILRGLWAKLIHVLLSACTTWAERVCIHHWQLYEKSWSIHIRILRDGRETQNWYKTRKKNTVVVGDFNGLIDLHVVYEKEDEERLSTVVLWKGNSKNERNVGSSTEERQRKHPGLEEKQLLMPETSSVRLNQDYLSSGRRSFNRSQIMFLSNSSYWECRLLSKREVECLGCCWPLGLHSLESTPAQIQVNFNPYPAGEMAHWQSAILIFGFRPKQIKIIPGFRSLIGSISASHSTEGHPRVWILILTPTEKLQPTELWLSLTDIMPEIEILPQSPL